MIFNFSIHKSLSCTPEEIFDSIEKSYEIPGVDVNVYRDGWIIAEPIDKSPELWKRNKDDYRTETLQVDEPHEEEKDEEYDRVEIKDGYIYFIRD